MPYRLCCRRLGMREVEYTLLLILRVYFYANLVATPSNRVFFSLLVLRRAIFESNILVVSYGLRCSDSKVGSQTYTTKHGTGVW